MLERRSFLRGLTTLPLIGGSVALIGQPTAAAVPITKSLLDSYETWLSIERNMLRCERYGVAEGSTPHLFSHEIVFRNLDSGRVYDWIAMDNDGARNLCGRLRAETRAAVILSAAGVPIGGAA